MTEVTINKVEMKKDTYLELDQNGRERVRKRVREREWSEGGRKDK